MLSNAHVFAHANTFADIDFSTGIVPFLKIVL